MRGWDEPTFAAAQTPHSLRSSSSGVGLWKKAIHGFIMYSGIWKLFSEGCEFLSRKPPEQLILRHIEVVHFTAGPKPLRPQSEVFAFLPRPETEIEDYIRSQHKRPAGYVPKHDLD